MQTPSRKSLALAGILCLAALFLAAQARAGDDKPWRHGKKLGDFSAESADSSGAAAPAGGGDKVEPAESENAEDSSKESKDSASASKGKAKDEYSWRHGKKLMGSPSEEDRSWHKGKQLGEFKSESPEAAATGGDSSDKPAPGGNCPLDPKEQQGAAFVQALQKALADKNEAEVTRLLSCSVPLSAEDQAEADKILNGADGAGTGSDEP